MEDEGGNDAVGGNDNVDTDPDDDGKADASAAPRLLDGGVAAIKVVAASAAGMGSEPGYILSSTTTMALASIDRGFGTYRRKSRDRGTPNTMAISANNNRKNASWHSRIRS